MGVAWLAYAESPAQPVVIKMMSPSLRDDRDMAARFRREARQLRGLQHPNIVRFIEFVEQSDQSFLVMEYAHGELLSHILQRHGPLPLPVFAPIAVQVLRGIAHAHEHGVVLRDVKPGNIMVCPRAPRPQIVKLLDFGLAKAVSTDSVITHHNEVLGTMGYLAPEILRGEQPDLRSDVYSLGALFYVMVTGQLPVEDFPGRRGARQASDSLPPVARLLLYSDLPREVSMLIDRCLAKDRERRPVHAGHVLQTLTRLIDPGNLQRDIEHHAGRVFGPNGFLSADSTRRRLARATQPPTGDPHDPADPADPTVSTRRTGGQGLDPLAEETTRRILLRR